jgi:glyoxylase-like metal-dependent hydrolase (beta-lactamase superfamily II)
MREVHIMVIPLEDLATDVVNKAQHGLRLSDNALAEKLGVSPDKLDAVKQVRGIPPALVETLARALELGPQALIALAGGRYSPQAKPPSPGFFQANTIFGEMTVNAYLVWDSETRLAAAFDTGADATPLIKEIEKQKLTLQDVFLTHTHIDHVMELDRLCEKTGGSIGIHVSEAEPLEGAVSFKPGVTFSLGRLQVETRDTSGHSPGGTTYHIHGLNAPLAVVGDALFAGSAGGIKSDYHAALRRIRDNILSAQNNTTIAPGHGPLTTVGQEKANNPFFPEFRQVLAKDI